MANTKAKKVVIVGGSLGGLFTGIVFLRLGYTVTILERTPASSLKDQGAGIAFYLMIPPIKEAMKNLGTSGAPIVDFMEQYDRTNTPTLTADGILYVNRDGSIRGVMGSGETAQVASWDLLYHVLRANFDGGLERSYVSAPKKEEGDGVASYVSGVRVSSLKEVGDLVEVEYEGVDGKKDSLEADIVVGADGPSSTVRKLLLPEVERNYTGYVTWRGTVKESLLSEETRNFLGTKVCSRLKFKITEVDRMQSAIAFTKGSQVVW